MMPPGESRRIPIWIFADSYSGAGILMVSRTILVQNRSLIQPAQRRVLVQNGLSEPKEAYYLGFGARSRSH
jgi:hypothetical protein